MESKARLPVACAGLRAAVRRQTRSGREAPARFVVLGRPVAGGAAPPVLGPPVLVRARRREDAFLLACAKEGLLPFDDQIRYEGLLAELSARGRCPPCVGDLVPLLLPEYFDEAVAPYLAESYAFLAPFPPWATAFRIACTRGDIAGALRSQPEEVPDFSEGFALACSHAHLDLVRELVEGLVLEYRADEIASVLQKGFEAACSGWSEGAAAVVELLLAVGGEALDGDAPEDFRPIDVHRGGDVAFIRAAMSPRRACARLLLGLYPEGYRGGGAFESARTRFLAEEAADAARA